MAGFLLALVASPLWAPIDTSIPPVVIQAIAPRSAAPGSTVRVEITLPNRYRPAAQRTPNSRPDPTPQFILLIPEKTSVVFGTEKVRPEAFTLAQGGRYQLTVRVPLQLKEGKLSLRVSIQDVGESEPRDFLVLAPPPTDSTASKGWLIALFLAATGVLAWGIWRLLNRLDARAKPGAPEAPVPEVVPAPLPPDDLVDACAAGDCVVYAGAGLSVGSGYPVWDGFVGDLLEWAIENRHVERTFGESLRAAFREGDSDLVADSIVGSLRGRESVLHDYLRESLGQPGRSLSRAHRILREIPFGAALSTNYDELLERAFGEDKPVYTPEDTDLLREALSERRFFVLKLYGTLSRPGTLVISPAQYKEIAPNRAFSQAMEGLFFSRTILFVGTSLHGIEAYLDGLSFRGGARRRHYALLAVSGAAWRAKADLLKRRYGIEVIPYQPSTSAHPEVLDFLYNLRDRVKATSRRRGPAVHADRIERLTRVRLENIGAFEELDVEVGPRWTLLLGDNGVGKSTVLEAVATAIAGKDAEPYAGRLIRTSSRTSRIVLSAGTNEYMATLAAREDGSADIELTPSRPLEAEGWLAIGFPPLRTVTWSRSKGPGPEGKRRPTTEDLLPLLQGGVDPRLDELKQWLVNLDYWSKSGPSESRSRYLRLRDEFFVMADDLLDGVSIRFKQVDEITHQVTVVTEDGVIPIEALSQGTASLLGWTGFLLQRLHEVYGSQEGDPRQGHALVLLDEIDAHMHPAWQQRLVERLSKAFPGAQFVASTHSPLIAGSLARTSVLRFRRDQGKVIAEHPHESVKGWRVDQILTGPLFGLQSGRESETQRMLLRYTELAARDDLDEAQDRELRELAAQLKVRMPTPEERQESRRAFELVQAAMAEHIRSMSPEEREKILAEAKVQLQEAATGSRRPQ